MVKSGQSAVSAVIVGTRLWLVVCRTHRLIFRLLIIGQVTNMTHDVSRELCVKVSSEIEQAAKEVFKAYGLVKGKVSSKYGEGYSIKIEGFSNDEVNKQTASTITTLIGNEVERIFTANSLTRTKTSTHFGEGYDVTFKADPLILGANGVNLGSDEAKWFKVVCDFRYGLDSSALGKEAVIKGKKHYLAGVKHWRDTYKIVTLSEGKLFTWTSERAITYFGGSYNEVKTLLAGAINETN